MPLIATTLLFAAGHLAAYPFVPAGYHGFVLYQSSYVLLLGLGAGYRRQCRQHVAAAMIVHFGFNLGFYLGSR